MAQATRKTFMASSVTIGMPAIVTVVLALLAGGLQVVNQLVFTSNPQIQGVIAMFLMFIVALGITPATGTAFRTLLHLPAWAYVVITAVLSALTGALQIAGLSTTAHTILATALTLAAALGFGANPVVAFAPKPIKGP
jgi:uncharacterized membrane protein YkvI